MSDTLAHLRASLSDRYVIEREIGAGGMARVFLAEDLRHHRKVAIKVLRPEMTAALGAERFLREIETIARLRHPHILPLFDSGAVGESLFYVMPFVEGESLRTRLDRERQLPLDVALQLTSEVAQALDYAHRRGVIHRDIKPENILLDDGHAVVTDFGIARVASDSQQGALTQTGLALGTPRYMSPEQAAGEREVDGRADLYSLACTLYEMLAGQPPFTAPTLERLVYQHLIEPPPPVTQFRPAVPTAVTRTLQRALAKAPADRFATALAFSEALRLPAAERAEARSVAVLPFVSMSADAENEYFADGITEDVIAQLSKIKALKVVSRTSVMQFKQREQGLREIAERLQVGALLEGSVRRVGGRVRIVAQLIDAASDQHLWAETYDRDLTDIFEIQSEVALHIAKALRAELTPDENLRIARQPTKDLRAYQLFLQGRQVLGKFTADGLRSALHYFERAIERDPDYAPAYSGIALALTDLGEQGVLTPEEAYPRAKAAAARAIALDDALGDGHCTMAYVKMVHDFDWGGAESEFKRALELSPSNADAYDLYGRLCAALERFDEAITMLQRAQELDPLMHRNDMATALLRAGRYEDALEVAMRTVEFDGENARAQSTLGWAYLGLGRVEEGLAALERGVALAPWSTMWLAQLAEAYALHGKVPQAREILGRLLEESRTRFVAPYHLAYIYTGLGQYDDAIDCLESAFASRSGAMYGVKGSFLFRPLHGHPRFVELLGRMHLA